MDAVACYLLLLLATGQPWGSMRVDELAGEVRVWDRQGRPVALAEALEADAVLWRLQSRLGPLRVVRKSCPGGG